jgi:multidrug resistance efflux pump
MLPIPVPSTPAPEPKRGPVAVPPPPPKPRRWGWFAALFAAAAIAAGAWRYASGTPDTTGTTGPAIRTATASAQRLDRVLRLTGVTAAENASQLLTPQLRGSRLGTNREAAGGVTAIAPLSVQSRAGGNTSPGASSSSSNLSTALRAATSRTGGAAAGSAQVSTSTSDSTSTTMGNEGIGTSAADLIARSQSGSNGANDFFLVLQDLVKPGSLVKKGQTVAEFDRQYMLTRLDDYKATVVQTEASLRRQVSDLSVARKAKEQELLAAKGDYEKAKLDMRTIPVLSALDVQRTKLALEETEAKYKQLETELKFLTASEKAQLRGSELALEQTRGEYKRSENNVARLLVKAPIDGLTVMQTTWRGGDYGQVQEGDQLYPGQGFMSIVDPRSMIVNALVNQADAEQLRIGLKAHVRFDAYPDLELPARVSSIGGIPRSSGARADWVKEIPVRLKLDRIDSRVLPDLSVAADVVIDSSEEQSVVVPVSSVFAEGGQSYVMVASSAGPQNWERRAVELGRSNYTHVVIRSGVKPGERVAEDRIATAGSKVN